jgi:hypothetical protein
MRLSLFILGILKVMDWVIDVVSRNAARRCQRCGSYIRWRADSARTRDKESPETNVSPIRRANNKTAAAVSLPAGKKGRCLLPGRRRPTINFAARGQPQANEGNGPVIASERHERSTLAHRSPTTGAQIYASPMWRSCVLVACVLVAHQCVCPSQVHIEQEGTL